MKIFASFILMSVSLFFSFPGIINAQNVSVGGNIDYENPTISITSPASGATVSGIVPVVVNVSDDGGIVKVEFYVDGILKQTITLAPYTYSWGTSSIGNGSHTVNAIVYDIVGNTASDSVNVVVNNTITTTPTSPSDDTPSPVSHKPTPTVKKPAGPDRYAPSENPIEYLEKILTGEKIFNIGTDTFISFILIIQILIIFFLLFLLKRKRKKKEPSDEDLGGSSFPSNV